MTESDIVKPRVVLGMPCGVGDVNIEAATALLTAWSCSSRSIEIVDRHTYKSSVTIGNFDEILARGLNWRNAGKATHLAMIHTDVAPESWWIDTYYAEMVIRNADFISGVIGIKEHERQKVSVAVAPLHDRWAVGRNLTWDDIAKLPDTFGPEHVCGPDEILLVNTGLWLADLRRPWWDEFDFTTLARKIKDDDGNWTVRVNAEDWELSRFLHSVGARYLATTKVKVKHYGTDYWTNPEF